MQSFAERFLQLSLAAAVLGAMAATTALGQTAGFPSKPIQVIVPFDAGGGVDGMMRIIGDEMAKEMGQRIVLDNRPGGDTMIGSQAMVRAAPDGYTLLAVTGTHTINPWLRKLPYDTLKDFAPVATLIRTQNMLLVTPSFPARTLKEFIAYGKANGDKVNVAATGGQNQLDTLMFMQNTGIKLTVVPYKSAASQINDLIAGVVQASFKSMEFAAPVRSGKLRALAVSKDSARSALLPDVPTFIEAGLDPSAARPGGYYALLAPAATPRDIIQKLNTEVRKAQASEAVEAAVERRGSSVFPSTVPETDAWIRKEYERYGRLIKEYGLKAE